jgi:hypothetical protein
VRFKACQGVGSDLGHMCGHIDVQRFATYVGWKVSKEVLKYGHLFLDAYRNLLPNLFSLAHCLKEGSPGVLRRRRECCGGVAFNI